MSLITPEYLELQKELHATGKYGIGNENEALVKWIRDVAPPESSILDYGCGQGTLKPLLPEYEVREYDPAIEGKDGLPDRADFVVCVDVLEHVEEQCLDLVIKHIKMLAMRRVLVVIDCRPAKKTLSDGRNAHVSLHPPDWWRDRLKPHFRIADWTAHENDEGLHAALEPSVQMGELKAVGVVDDAQRNEYVAQNIGRSWRRINQQPAQDNGKTLIVCAYGPSIRHTVKDILKQKEEFNAEIVSVSGSHDWLRKKGIKPDWHVECDPRLHKSEMMGRSRKGVKYLMASCCHPDFIKRLADEGAELILWHLFNGPESFKIREHKSEYEQALIPGGGSVALRAFVLFYFMGYRRFIVHGFDCSFAEDGKTHAGPHSNKTGQNGTPYKQSIRVRAEGSDDWYDTAPVMITYAKHMLKDLQKGRYPGCEFAFMGNGLFQTMLRLHLAEQAKLEKGPPAPTRDYFHLTEEDVEPHEVYGRPPEVQNG